MEDTSAAPGLRTLLVTAVAPAAWGTTYLVTSTWLPDDRPLTSAALRALPAGLLLLAWRRRLPSGAWWWRSALLGTLTIGAFFPLLFLAAYRLPGGLAATVQATSPLTVMLLAWLLLRERSGLPRVGAALVGLGGVALLVVRAPGGVDPLGLGAALASVVVSAVGFVLVKRWPAPVDLLTLVSWQLLAGGLLLAPVALLVEGPLPAVDAPAVLGYLWIGSVGTVVAYTWWFHGLAHLPAGAVGLVGLLNPVVGTALGALVAGELFGPAQAAGTGLVLLGVLGGQPVAIAAARRAVAVARRRAARCGPVESRSRGGAIMNG